jgi:hypothetical protein
MVENYRGITLLSTMGKLFTKVLNNRLTYWAENYNVYIEAQAGFRKNMGTVDNIFVLHGVINHVLNTGKRLYAAFVDFTKAFDFVVRDIIWYKLLKLGVRGKILNVIQSIYENVKSKIKHHNTLSDDFSCLLGVRQGESLSPFLFSMYLNDIEENFMLNGFEGIDIGLLKLFLLLYADDIVIFSETESGLQKGLDILYEYCLRWKLTVNVEKTKIMIFKKSGRIRQNIQFMYDNKIIEIVSKFTYLGIVFTSGGAFGETTEALCGQAQKAIFKLNSYLYKYPGIKISHSLELFDKLILPILHYGSEVWGFNEGINVERVHLQYCKRILGVRPQTQNDFIYGELGRTNIKTLRYVNIIRYWLKIVCLNELKYVKSVYKTMIQELERNPGKNSWVKSVKNLLDNLGFNQVWIFQGVGNVNIFMTVFKERVRNHFQQNWNVNLNESSRARTYKLFSDWKFQPYLDVIKIVKFRQAYTRFRISAHRLAIESGRWHKPVKIPYDNRKCFACNTLEDEFHFLLECPIYIEIRKLYIKRYYREHPNMVKFIELMKCENITIIKNVATFIQKAFELRSSINNL